MIASPVPLETNNSLKSKVEGRNYSPSFFFGTDRGSIVYADDVGHCTEVQQHPSSVDVMMFLEERSRLVVINRSCLLTQYHVSDDGKVSRVMQVKLSISPDLSDRGLKSVVWAGPGILAMATEEKMVRFVDLAVDESYNISLASSLGGFIDRTDRACYVAFSPIDRYLAVGTHLGVVAVWKFIGSSRDISSSAKATPPSTSSQDWELVFRTSLGSQVLQMSWAVGGGSLCVVTEEGAVVLNESIIQSKICGDLTVVQETAHEVSIHHLGSAEANSIHTGIQIRGMALGRSCFVVWSSKVAKIYRVDPQTSRIESLDPIKISSPAMAIADASFIVDEAWFVADGLVVKVNNFKGVQKGVVNFSEAEGMPVCLDVNGKYLAVITNKGCIKVSDVHTPKQPKLLGTAGQFYSGKNSNLSAMSTTKIKSIKINNSGTMIAILCNHIEGTEQLSFPDSRLFVFDRNKGTILSYDFQAMKRIPVAVFWDEFDDRLFACETVSVRVTAVSTSGRKASSETEEELMKANGEQEFSGLEVFLMFATSDQGILMQDSVRSVGQMGGLMGLCAPKVFYRMQTKHTNREDDTDVGGCELIAGTNILFKTMRDFVGIEHLSDSVKTSLLDFSLYLTLGKLDEAYRVVKEINSTSIWENMAQMCVKTKRLDVAEVCLGNMGHARGAAAVREAKKDGSLEVVIGVLAIQLGLIEDAAVLFREAGRYDLLNNLYQASGRWQKAIIIAESKDRIHLKSTHYNYAKYLESIGRVDDAIEHYQISENARHEVPRMLFHLGRIEELGEYVLQTEDTALLKWWASYLESIGKVENAKKYYNKAKDFLSLVRIACFQVRIEETLALHIIE